MSNPVFADVTEEDLKKYSLLLGKSNDEIKKDLQELCKNYYLEYLFNNPERFKECADKLNDYLKLEVAAINDYINYCLLISINTLLEKMYHIEGYQAANPGFAIKRYQQKKAKKFIDQYGLTPDEVSQTIEYNKQSNDLWILRELTNLTIHTKPNIDLPPKVRGTAFANINYLGTGEDEIYNIAKLFLGLSIALGGNDKDNFREWFNNDYLKKSR